MDAYDIYKKLTRVCKFSKEHNPHLFRDKTPKKKDEKVDSIKSEVKIEKNEEHEGNKKSVEEEEVKEDSSDFLVLRSDVKKGKKRKHEEEHDERKKKLLAEEAINHYRNINNISVVGRHVPEPAKTFDDFAVDEDIIGNLKDCGYEEPTPIQKQAIPIMVQGRQILACAPTGSGKTAAFLVPIIQSLKKPRKKSFRALILCPTRELAKQTQRECLRLSEGRGFRVHIMSKIKKALTQYGAQSNKKYDILITTPNRLCYLLKQDPPAISLSNVKWLVIDEADKLFEDGNRSFRDQLSEVLTACNNKDRKIAMFSATHTPVVAKWCVHNMKNLVRVTVGHRNAAVDSVDQELVFVSFEQGKLLAFRNIIRNGVKPPILVFVQSKERAQQLFNELIYDNIRVDVIHADRTQTQRDNTVRCFREGKIWVLICTELMARGIDFKGVNLVINYDFPPSVISYIHRIGRAGRAGSKGKAVTFWTLDDAPNLRSIAHVLKESGCEVPSFMLSIKKKPKKMKKKMESAPKREDITTKPIYERIKGGKRKKFREIAKLNKNKETIGPKPQNRKLVSSSKGNTPPKTQNKKMVSNNKNASKKQQNKKVVSSKLKNFKKSTKIKERRKE